MIQFGSMNQSILIQFLWLVCFLLLIALVFELKKKKRNSNKSQYSWISLFNRYFNIGNAPKDTQVYHLDLDCDPKKGILYIWEDRFINKRWQSAIIILSIQNHVIKRFIGDQLIDFVYLENVIAKPATATKSSKKSLFTLINVQDNTILWILAARDDCEEYDWINAINRASIVNESSRRYMREQKE